MGKVFVLFALVMTVMTGYCERSVLLGPLPDWSFADTEVSTNAHFAVGDGDSRDMRFSLELQATPSNNVQVAFGTDGDADGELSADEEGFCVAWDCGVWVTRRGLDGVKNAAEAGEPFYECAPATTNAIKRLDWWFHTTKTERRRLIVLENGCDAPLTADEIPPWIWDPAWNTVRLTVRGLGGRDGLFRASVETVGTRIVIR